MAISTLLTRTVAIGALAFAASAEAASLTYADLIGWWRSNLEFNGQRAEMLRVQGGVT